jgi:hypothetical protein
MLYIYIAVIVIPVNVPRWQELLYWSSMIENKITWNLNILGEENEHDLRILVSFCKIQNANIFSYHLRNFFIKMNIY